MKKSRYCQSIILKKGGISENQISTSSDQFIRRAEVL